MDINKKEIAEVVEVFKCPNCKEYFNFAPRCPHCGQLIANGKPNVIAVKEALSMWAEGKEVAGINKPNRGIIFTSLMIGITDLYHFGSTRCIDPEELEYWKFFGFNVEPEGIGWKITQCL